MKHLSLFGLALGAMLCFSACGNNDSKGGEETPVVDNGFAKGADISWITELEAGGHRFYNAAGTMPRARSGSVRP